MAIIGQFWFRSKSSSFTPGGDPVWKCPKCGWEHIHGTEHPESYHACPSCGLSLRYPWESTGINSPS